MFVERRAIIAIGTVNHQGPGMHVDHVQCSVWIPIVARKVKANRLSGNTMCGWSGDDTPVHATAR